MPVPDVRRRMMQEGKHYLVVVTEITHDKTTKREYQKVADSGNPRDGGPVYEYVEFEGQEKVSRELVNLRRDELDLDAVVAAVMGWRETSR